MTTKTHRSAEGRIAELNAKIESIRVRGERRRAEAKPEVQSAIAATKVLGATTDQTLRTAFQEVRTTVAAFSAEGAAVAESRARNPAKQRKDART